MKLSKRTATAIAAATALAVPAEGLRQTAYRDPVGILTVCYGKTAGVETDKLYSLQECKSHLEKDMLKAIESVERCAPGLPEKTLAAFADAAYNLGPAIVCNADKSTAARLLKAGDIEGACHQLPRWNKAKVAGVMISLPGLTKRREAEKALCLAGIKEARNQ